MRLGTGYKRASVSLFVATAVMMVFTLRSFAAPEIVKPEIDPLVAQDCNGTLTVKAGQITINGNPAQTGATVMTGSTITTSSNGNAIIDLGALGRVEVGESTTVIIMCAGGSLQIRSSCTKTEVEVRSGTLNVTSPTTEALAAGKEEDYDGSIEANSTGAIDVKIECEGGKAAAAPYIGAGLLGLLALIGVGAAIAIGVGLGDNDSSTPSSPIR